MPDRYSVLFLAAICLIASGCAKKSAPLTRGDFYQNEQACANAKDNAQIQKVFYVSPHGSDSGSGTFTQPFLTVQKAQEEVRKINSSMTGDIQVKIKSGDYYLLTPLSFDERDSGSNSFRVIYENADSVGSARFIGGIKVNQWLRYSGSIYKAQLPLGTKFSTLYVDGKRVDEARYPKRQSTLPLSHAHYLHTLATKEAPESLFDFGYDPAEMPALPQDLSQVKVFIWPYGVAAWTSEVHRVKSVDSIAHKIVLADRVKLIIYDHSKYFLEGDLSFLTSPGEYAFDTRTSTLYYWPLDGKIQRHEVIYPTMNTVVKLEGVQYHEIRNLELRGLTFEDSDFSNYYQLGYRRIFAFRGPNYPVPDQQGLVRMAYTYRVALRNVHIKNAGFSGIYAFLFDQQDCIYGNLIEGVGVDGINLEGPYPGEGDGIRENVVSNNWIHHVGEMVGHGAGITVHGAGFNEIAYSRIEDSPRFGIQVRDLPKDGDIYYSRGNYIHHILIQRVAQDSGDTAAIYTNGLGRYTHQAQNYFNQIIIDTAFSDPSMNNLLPHGVYFDENTGTQSIYNTLVRNTAGTPYFDNSGYAHDIRNVSWEADFDPRLIETSAIGLKADFPKEYLPSMGTVR